MSPLKSVFGVTSLSLVLAVKRYPSEGTSSSVWLPSALPCCLGCLRSISSIRHVYIIRLRCGRPSVYACPSTAAALGVSLMSVTVNVYTVAVAVLPSVVLYRVREAVAAYEIVIARILKVVADELHAAVMPTASVSPSAIAVPLTLYHRQAAIIFSACVKVQQSIRVRIASHCPLRQSVTVASSATVMPCVINSSRVVL